ncbi:nitrate/nitrite transporter [Terracoccus luteus]|uniref:NNP family nitrate/nitrite transporter-like MFS transporter n=1 Tax=Terracoccus luteus TaxID=53356 RepID=A0A839PUJ6_9MICO|nr:nitrate/nitrite transporter [Terracoccus luteus]MBB2985656.1 NNP family nitrate/nitrite transporter-like MFS transporter [Terracoccus luteus]MCP2171308.1 NNP family nitrate/nitrite transporter-like MFS transporter [Terracoccus luteus]
MSTTADSTTESTTGSAAGPVSTLAPEHTGRLRQLTAPRRRVIRDWDPEDTAAWAAGNDRIARRNLVWSVATEHVGFSIWSIWSVMVLFMPQAVYGFTPADKFVLVAVPTLVGAVLRVPYTMATAWFGGRNWAIVSAVALLVPTVLTWWLMVNPGQSLTTFLLVAGLAGLGGGNFASSMTNINAFYPQRMKGWALGLNAGGGNIGVPVVQLVGLLVIATLGNRRPEVVCAVYLVLLAVAGVGAALFMDNLDHQTANPGAMGDVLRHADSWVVSLLYIGTFGSFIGFGFAFGQVLNQTFLAGVTNGATPTAAQAAAASLQAAQIAFVGPLLGSVSRVFGGRLADRRGGGVVTFWTFVGMAVAGVLVTASAHADDTTPGAATALQLTGIIGGFVALFVLSGIGNGSVYKMIPALFERKSQAVPGPAVERAAWSRSMSGALIGIAGAVGALGGVLINLGLRASYQGESHSATAAFVVFTLFYVGAAALTKVRYR